MREYLRKKFLNWLVKDLFNTIQEEDLLQILPNGAILYRGKKLDDEKALQLREDADKFNNSVLWKLLSDDAKYQANFRMYENSSDYGGMMFGKAMLFNLDVIEKRLKQLCMKD